MIRSARGDPRPRMREERHSITVHGTAVGGAAIHEVLFASSLGGLLHRSRRCAATVSSSHRFRSANRRLLHRSRRCAAAVSSLQINGFIVPRQEAP